MAAANINIDLKNCAVLDVEDYMQMRIKLETLSGLAEMCKTGWEVRLDSAQIREKYPDIQPFTIDKHHTCIPHEIVAKAAQGFIDTVLADDELKDVTLRWAVSKDAHYFDVLSLDMSAYRTSTSYDLLEYQTLKDEWLHYKEMLGKEEDSE